MVFRGQLLPAGSKRPVNSPDCLVEDTCVSPEAGSAVEPLVSKVVCHNMQLKVSRFVEIGTRRQILYISQLVYVYTSCIATTTMILDPRAWNLATSSALAVCRAQASLEDPKDSGLFSHGAKVKLVCLFVIITTQIHHRGRLHRNARLG